MGRKIWFIKTLKCLNKEQIKMQDENNEKQNTTEIKRELEQRSYLFLEGKFLSKFIDLFQISSKSQWQLK